MNTTRHHIIKKQEFHEGITPDGSTSSPTGVATLRGSLFTRSYRTVSPRPQEALPTADTHSTSLMQFGGNADGAVVLSSNFIVVFILFTILFSACQFKFTMEIEGWETNKKGEKMREIAFEAQGESDQIIEIFPDQTFQTITGIGGSFTEASAYLLNRLSPENRHAILEAYFGDSGAKYSLTRTHINSCDFSLGNYSYAPIADDLALVHFSIQEDMDDLIPMIKDAMKLSSEGFKIIASPWTAPPWMKDNQDWRGGKLLKEHYPTWALFFTKYLKAYQDQGINIWGVTVENEPLGNDNNWESMHFTASEMNDFVKNHLGPKLQNDGWNIPILGFDQNRDEALFHWVDTMYGDAEAAKYYGGTAVHWYASTFEVFPEALQYAHSKAPTKHLIQTEACVDAQVPVWRDDEWYWSANATDWGWDWAPEDQKYLHPMYVPVHRYARDIIGCLNNWIDGWVDWNMVLDRQGGPNWFKNWCVAPVIVDPEQDEVYFTPLYYVMSHFSKYIRPGAQRIGFKTNNENLLLTALRNTSGEVVLILFNPTDDPQKIQLKFGNFNQFHSVSGQSLQTLVIKHSSNQSI